MLKLNLPNIARTNSYNADLSGAPNAGDIYTLKIENVKGENLIVGPEKDAMPIATWEIAVDLPVDINTATALRTTGRARFQEMSFTKPIDATTTVLYNSCATGTVFNSAKFQVGRISKGEYVEMMVITLTEPVVSQISTGGYGEGKVAMDSFTLNYTSISVDYVQPKSDGTKDGRLAFAWDLLKFVAK